MLKNDPSALDIPALLALAAQLDQTLAGEGAGDYHVPAPLVAACVAARTSLSASASATETARAAYLAQKGGRDADRQALVTAVSTLARAIFAVPTNTPAMVLAAGLRPRSTSRTKVVPVTPEKLFASPLPSGDVLLEWDRTGNAPGVNFVVESRLPGGEWAYCGDTTALRLKVSGYAPGQSVEFRVSASKNKTTSTPSAVATVFPTQASSPALRLAA